MSPQELASLHNALGKSQDKLAKLLGISIRSIQAYEQGWREVPTQPAASRLSKRGEEIKKNIDLI